MGGIVDLTADLSRSPHYNPDIAPIPAARRKWGMWDIAALWVGMSVCIPTYMLASSLIAGGMSWWQAILTILLGNVIVLGPMVLNAHAGTKYGIPFPVFCRASFGILGSNIPAILRAMVACGWFGIQTWIGGWSIYKLVCVVYPGIAAWPALFPTGWGLTSGTGLCFLIFWAINMGIVWRGMESIRILEDWGAPFLILVGLALLVWALVRAGGFGPMFAQPSTFKNAGEFWSFFVPGLTGMIAYWATLSLNIPDFTRFARSQKDQVYGQAIGLPTTMTLYAFIGVAVTSATVVIFGKMIWDPVELLSRFTNPAVVVISLLGLAIATLTTNLAANVVSPANDFSNLWPKKISFKTGGFITGIVGILIMPWKLIADPRGYIFTWLIGYSALLGPIGGILIGDYFVLRRTKLNLPDLYRASGEYRYRGGFNGRAIAALVAGVLPNIPGFLNQLGVKGIGTFWSGLYAYAWFTGFALAFAVYLLLMKLLPPRLARPTF
ncbi:MAG: NCS1 family nucleobase:cation symporter-1 [Candidatus Aureabacteria bacterium]|nr:NCS1 family nucleobase:cation symporter-1 [Candidatus Auribacterota bacterium]